MGKSTLILSILLATTVAGGTAYAVYDTTKEAPVSVDHAYLDDNSDLIVVYSNGTETNLGNVKGPAGPQGPQGNPGTNGTNGENGADGEDGKDGKDGAQGPQGNNGTDGNDGADGEDGEDGITPHIDETSGNWFIGEIDTGIKAAGTPGTNGISPHIDTTTGHWFVGEEDTGVSAQGPKGDKGNDGSDGSDGNDGEDGYTPIKGVDYFDGEDGEDGLTPYIGDNGNWWIGETDTNVSATGKRVSCLYGKTVSILGDSISTFGGYIPSGHRARYPQDNLITDVDLTWWKRLIDDTGAILGVNESWAGSFVANNQATNSGDRGPDACMASMTRLTNLAANGVPDIIFFYGGTNDIGNAYEIGSFDTTINYALDTTSKTWATFADAYKTAIMRMQYLYPKTKLVAMIPTYTTSYYGANELNAYATEIIKICDYFGVDYVDLRKTGMNTSNINKYLGDGIHPNADGMKLIENVLLRYIDNLYLENFEKDAFTVTQDLSYVISTYNSITRITKGEDFTATLTPRLGYAMDTVEVIYGEDDVTETAYNAATGKVTIQNVTKPIKITATAEWDGEEPLVPAANNDHCSFIPKECKNSTNLWNVIPHEDIYYTGSEWGTLQNRNVGSITIPVTPGQHIYSSDFAEGIRVTYFNDNQVVNSIDPTSVASEFARNSGYIVVPSGVNCVNIPVWDKDGSNTIKILNLVEIEMVNVTLNLEYVTSSFNANKTEKEEDFTTTLSPNYGYKIDSVEVIYGEDNVTETAYNAATGKITIENVTKDIVITASGVIDDTPTVLPTTSNSHAQPLPSDITKDTNLWNVLEHSNYHFSSTQQWEVVSPIGSITFPVKPGYRIYSSSFGAMPGNGGSSNGIRMSMFLDDTLVATYSPGDTYAMFNANGYIEIPNGVNCINVVVWDMNSATNVVKILNPIPIETFKITQDLTNVSSNFAQEKIEKGETFEAILSGTTGYKVDEVTVLYGEDDVTLTAYDPDNRIVRIENVEKAITITATGVEGEDAIVLPTTANSYASQLPDALTSTTNLWSVLDHQDDYYGGTAWTKNGDVGSITFAVKPGYRIVCNSFGASPANGGNVNGIRITTFNDNTVVKSYSPAETYEEFMQKGYIEIPNGVNCINVPVWQISYANNEVLIINVF